MNKFLKISLYCILCATANISFSLDSMITLFIQKYPMFKNKKQKQVNTEKYSKKLRQPDYIYKTTIKPAFQTGISGVMCLYGGRITLSDNNGQISFPRQQQTPNVYLLISQGIKPAYMIAPTTIHNWLLDSSHPAKIYEMKLYHDDATELYYYLVSETTFPNHNSIPLNTIVLIADPNFVYVPLGATITDYSSNITLPPIYLKKGFCFVYNSLYSLAIKQYYEQTSVMTKQDGANVAQIEQVV